eukprot:g67395.t1
MESSYLIFWYLPDASCERGGTIRGQSGKCGFQTGVLLHRLSSDMKGANRRKRSVTLSSKTPTMDQLFYKTCESCGDVCMCEVDYSKIIHFPKPVEKGKIRGCAWGCVWGCDCPEVAPPDFIDV